MRGGRRLLAVLNPVLFLNRGEERLPLGRELGVSTVQAVRDEVEKAAKFSRLVRNRVTGKGGHLYVTDDFLKFQGARAGWAPSTRGKRQ